MPRNSSTGRKPRNDTSTKKRKRIRFMREEQRRREQYIQRQEAAKESAEKADFKVGFGL